MVLESGFWQGLWFAGNRLFPGEPPIGHCECPDPPAEEVGGAVGVEHYGRHGLGRGLRHDEPRRDCLREARQVGRVEALQQLRHPMLLPLRQHAGAGLAAAVISYVVTSGVGIAAATQVPTDRLPTLHTLPRSRVPDCCSPPDKRTKLQVVPIPFAAAAAVLLLLFRRRRRRLLRTKVNSASFSVRS